MKLSSVMLNLSIFYLCLTISLSAVPCKADDETLTQARRIFSPLPQVMASEKNPVTPEKVALGKMLFYESRISIDGTVSCAKCHPMSLHAVDGLRKAVGNNCRINPRNAPTVFNAAAQISAHWIGNRTDVEDQARQAVTAPPAFGMPSRESAEKRLKEFSVYTELFNKAFPVDKEPVTVENFAKAVGAFERTLITPSPFDSFLKGSGDAISEKQKRGLKTFMATGCITCHFGTYVGGQMYQKFGIIEPYWKYTKSEKIDQGRFEVTKNEADMYVFKVPVLRNVEKTSPYFHDGSVDTLEEAVIIMAKIQLARYLKSEEADDITAFLGSLTGKIPDDILLVPVLPSK
jgi:cytochrome c peroxidase